MNHAFPQGHVFYRKMSHPRPQIASGSGIYLVDDQGRRYLDGSGGPLVVNVGHGRPEVVEAIRRQAEQAAYVHAVMFTSGSVEAYAAAMAQYLPMDDVRLYFLSSGSEVVEGAIKLARQIQMARGAAPRHVVISRWQSYHGMTLGALASSGREGLRAPYINMMAHPVHIRPPYPYRDCVSGAQAAERLENAILDTGPDQVAAFLAEPISGASLGAVIPDDEYWPRIREICDRYGVLLIADEVLVGMGRTGRWWGLNHWDVRPDILVASKGTAGGYFPFGFIAAAGADVALIQQKLGDFNHGGTFSHHAVGAAAALAVLRIYEKEQLVARAAELGAYLEQRLQQALGDHPHVGDIRGRGLFFALELVADRATRAPFSAAQQVAWRIWEAAFARGLIVYYSQGCADGKNGDLIMVGPPLIITTAQIDELVDLLKAAVAAVLPG